MRFVLDSAVAQPGVDLGEAPEPRFEPTARDVDHGAALKGMAREAESLLHRLRELSQLEWERRAIIGDDEVDGHWICRHAVHDATHHLMDVERLRVALDVPRVPPIAGLVSPSPGFGGGTEGRAKDVDARWDEVTDTLTDRFPKAAQSMRDAMTDVLAFTAFPDRTGARSRPTTRSNG